MGFEPTTFCLGSRHSTPELHPPGNQVHLIRAGRAAQLPASSSLTSFVPFTIASSFR